jgi:hypothetical protein
MISGEAKAEIIYARSQPFAEMVSADVVLGDRSTSIGDVEGHDDRRIGTAIGPPIRDFTGRLHPERAGNPRSHHLPPLRVGGRQSRPPGALLVHLNPTNAISRQHDTTHRGDPGRSQTPSFLVVGGDYVL